jgi:hypothetical protein
MLLRSKAKERIGDAAHDIATGEVSLEAVFGFVSGQDLSRAASPQQASAALLDQLLQATSVVRHS